MTRHEWDILSDAELRRRLIQRGCPTETAIGLVSRRDEPDSGSVIDGWLTR